MQVLLSTLGQSYAATVARSESMILHIMRMEKMEGEPVRDAKADQAQKTQCKDTTSHCFMRENTWRHSNQKFLQNGCAS